MDNESWREQTLELLKQILQPNNQVLSFSVYGSLANTEVEKDRWSDIDALLVVENSALDSFFPNIEWLKQLGEVFIVQQSSNDITHVTKIIFNDFKKIDLVITTKSKILEMEPFWTKQLFVFSKSDEIKQILEEKALTKVPDNSSTYDIEKLANEYWYISFTVVIKIIRNDLLIALHLALELYRLCLVLGMWLRDSDTGTSVHRTGGVRNEIIENMDIKLEKMTKERILSLVEQCGKEFDKLALEWSPNYAPKLPTFERLLVEAKKDLSIKYVPI